MSQFRWAVVLAVVCLPLVYLAAGFRLPWLDRAATPIATVPDGDHEIAWLNTTTGGATWERFVTGVKRLERIDPAISVNESRAFPNRASQVPEIIVQKAGMSAKIFIRWYKVSSEQPVTDWVTELVNRVPAPLAIIGGSSSDRARELAMALDAQTITARPVLALTNATAIDVAAPDGSSEPTIPLMHIYRNRTFRYCFNNRQMAEAMLDCIGQHPTLKPASLDGSRLERPAVLSVSWNDDPYSDDMVVEFGRAVSTAYRSWANVGQPQPFRWRVPFSIGGFSTPNFAEAEAASSILRELKALPRQRSLLMMPTVTAPARRLLIRLCEENAEIGRHLIALNGDGMGVNAVLRDGEFNWPVASIPVPLALFCHNDPAAWDETLTLPNATDDVLHYSAIVQSLSDAIFHLYEAAHDITADELASTLKNGLQSDAFDATGNRRGGTGESVFILRPGASTHDGVTRFEVWRRRDDRSWHQTADRILPISGVSP
jgi:hypothetical protein